MVCTGPGCGRLLHVTSQPGRPEGRRDRAGLGGTLQQSRRRGSSRLRPQGAHDAAFFLYSITTLVLFFSVLGIIFVSTETKKSKQQPKPGRLLDYGSRFESHKIEVVLRLLPVETLTWLIDVARVGL